jgi:hypothetical protein
MIKAKDAVTALRNAVSPGLLIQATDTTRF